MHAKQGRPSANRHGPRVPGWDGGRDDGAGGAQARAAPRLRAESAEGGPADGARTEGDELRRQDELPEAAHTVEGEGPVRRGDEHQAADEEADHDIGEGVGMFSAFCMVKI